MGAALWLAARAAVCAPTPPEDGIQFNGKTSHAVVADVGRVEWTPLTVAAWVKVRTVDRSQVFLNRGGAPDLFTFYLFRQKMRMLVAYEPGKYTHADAPLPPVNTWVHYAGTYDGKKVKAYMNGVLKHTVEAPGKIAKSGEDLIIGALSPWERHLDGWLEDVRIWSRVLEDDEIARVASGAADAELSKGLIARWLARDMADGTWASAAGKGLTAKYTDEVKPMVRKDDGYRGIWYANQRLKNEYVWKYSGGLGTYCAKHIPFAYYAKEANKTFFCYGGAMKNRNRLVHMVSYYDHKTGMVPRPTLLLDKGTTDAHDNPTIMLDDDGYVWIFSSSHGTARPSFIHRSTEPYSVESFQHVLTTNFSYTQPWHLPGLGFLFIHIRYIGGRSVYQMTSRDGFTWAEPQLLSRIDKGHYEISWRHGKKLGVSFNYHPHPKGLNWRTNLYYMESGDFGKTWQNVQGEALAVPLKEPDNGALVHDYKADGRLVYMKGINYDSQGRPVILYVTSKGFESGPENAPRTWTTARWTGSEWEMRGSIVSDNNYDMGSLYVERDDLWRIIAPTQPGPQPYNPGGEVAMWASTDMGRTWQMEKQLTTDSELNHTYVRRPVNAHPGFYAFWADGHGRKQSASRLYFTDRSGSHVWRLPVEMKGKYQKPEQVW